MNSRSQPTYKSRTSPACEMNLLIVASAFICCLLGCAHSKNSDGSTDFFGSASDDTGKTIDYPFAEDSKTIAKSPEEDKFVIRSTVGQTEYQIEIPGAARDYDIEVPLADMRKIGAQDLSTPGVNGGGGPMIDESIRPQSTDNELARNMPKLEDPDERSLVEGAFGVGQTDGAHQSPSYTMHLTRINQLYVQKQMELALVEINNLLTYYPTSVRLYKMKGTILIKTKNFKMAEVAWTRALELAPEDQSLRTALQSLRNRMQQNEQSARSATLAPSSTPDNK